MRVSVIGNCQSVSLRQILMALRGDIDSQVLPNVYELSDIFKKAVCEDLEHSDWIVAQLVSPEYVVDYVRTETLRAQYGDKLIVWPNVYFSGYSPDFDVIHDVEFHNFRGPLLDYHSDKLLYAFLHGWSV